MTTTNNTNTNVSTTSVSKPKFNLPEKVFGFKDFNSQTVFDVILAERASKRQGTHKVKSRAEVSGTGKKPWKQKGTGRARTGSLRTPVFVGGGRAFGPTVERNYNLKINKKVRNLAFKSALSQLGLNNQVVVDKIKLEKISTKSLIEELRKKDIDLDKLKNVLFITNDPAIYLSGRNLAKITFSKVTSISVEALIRTDLMIISEEDVKYLEGIVK
ncbi:50S ribosomal protein L4 [Mesomycoplasma neurolyticum]|uniref:Large ribosomal subunit protein uL4 n=1 Tax=Mesomycoplasma neurolyticum TaxID=2120 RepID=A0A449A682_9BACT|nr:50S ribosomal protein L4 [Mesomycoplasma neurolyticum]VEU59727.1 50S ribosomal protein L4 [Mesomycoplasma neurolyticum]